VIASRPITGRPKSHFIMAGVHNAFSWVFLAPGTRRYFCSLHPHVQSTVAEVNGDRAAMRVGDQVLGYARAMQAMHWGIVALLLWAYLAAWMIDGASSPAEKVSLIMLHWSFGVTILLLTWMRLALRLRTRVPLLPPDVPAVQCFGARASVVTFIVQPLLGLVASMLHGGRTMLFGDVVLRPLLPVERAPAHQVFRRVHAWTALVLLALIGLHVTAAFYHHFVRKDEVLASMLPGMQRLPPRPVTLGPG
jgi:cytochrome b561